MVHGLCGWCIFIRDSILLLYHLQQIGFILWSKMAALVLTIISSMQQKRVTICSLYGHSLELAGIASAHTVRRP